MTRESPPRRAVHRKSTQASSARTAATITARPSTTKLPAIRFRHTAAYPRRVPPCSRHGTVRAGSSLT